MILEKLVQLQNIRMVHALEDTNFALKLVLLVVFQELFVNNLYSSQRLGLLVEAFSHLSIRAYK